VSKWLYGAGTRAGGGWSSRLRQAATAMFVMALVIGTHLSISAWMNRPVAEVGYTDVIRGVSFSPYQPDDNPYEHQYPSAEEIDADLARLQGTVASVRTYSSMNGFENVPRLAQKYGMKVMVGAWLDRRKENNVKEIVNAVKNAQRYSNVNRVIIGNEAILRSDLTVDELITYIKKVRARVRQPVSTAEPWHVWLQNPELAKAVDFITIHVLPYWEGVPASQSMDWVIERYRMVQAAFPNKKVVIGETGWPSAGNRKKDAKPSLVNASRFVRQFLNYARAQKLDYYIVEAYDQPWKRVEEGSVGPHWGLYTVDRQQKYPMTGEIIDDPNWLPKALAASLLVLGPMLWFAGRRQDVRVGGRLFFATLLQLAGAVLVWCALLPVAEALSGASLLVWAMLLPAQLMLVAVVLINGFEMAEMLWQSRMHRNFKPLHPSVGEGFAPKVSLHLPIHNEPPDVVIETLNSLARLDYPDYEVLVLDNNTKDPAVWEPVKAHCERLGERFRFFHLENWPGYKAGALNFGLTVTAPDAQIVGVIDSDYVIDSNWLSSLIPYFRREQVGFVQAPQDHRAWDNSYFKTMINWEYNGFFEIGMVQRNERNAIIQHGTMTLISRSALESSGNWGEWCICEDAELGLRLLASGHESVYVNHVFGRGVTPDTFTAYKNQRFRWVYGAVQIIRGHWRKLLGLEPGLTLGQRFHFVGGWLPWFADAIHLVFTFAGVLWTIGVLTLPQYFSFPLREFVWPVLAVFAFKIVHSLSLYGARVKCGWSGRFGAAIAGMGLTHTIAKAIFTGIFYKSRPFLRTPKSASQLALVQGFAMAREETLVALALLGAALASVLHVDAVSTINNAADARSAEVWWWAAVLVVQAVPYLAALAMGVISGLPERTATQPVLQGELQPVRVSA
jgi:exo-beta-1,3-glucanase (GH17 family)/cellulose synthase/poly-beta-1,6-N-acetylglucosamine synthase-like glycosyltransferase